MHSTVAGTNNCLRPEAIDALFERLDSGWSLNKIANALEIDLNTVMQYKSMRTFILRRYGAKHISWRRDRPETKSKWRQFWDAFWIAYKRKRNA